jgi:hypothetical protein
VRPNEGTSTVPRGGGNEKKRFKASRSGNSGQGVLAFFVPCYTVYFRQGLSITFDIYRTVKKNVSSDQLFLHGITGDIVVGALGANQLAVERM